MEINFGPRGILEINDARIIHRNFEGRGDKYNREGDRNFAVIIPNHEIADKLIEAGWNVKIKPPRNDDEEPFMFLPVKIKFNGRGPQVYLRTGSKLNRLDEESVGILDQVDIRSVDLDIRPYEWNVNGKNGITAYLQAIEVIQEIDRFAARDEESEF